MSQRLSKPFGPPALASQAPPAIILAALRRFRGPALFGGLRPSSSQGAPFWPSGLTLRSSGPAFCGPLTLAVRKVVMENFETLEAIAVVLGDGGQFNPDRKFETVGELVDALVSLGNTDKVFARHDEHLGLKIDLPEEFLESPLEVDNQEEFEEKFKDEIQRVADNANRIIPLSRRELSEDDLDEIREDKLYRGEDVDD